MAAILIRCEQARQDCPASVRAAAQSLIMETSMGLLNGLMGHGSDIDPASLGLGSEWPPLVLVRFGLP